MKQNDTRPIRIFTLTQTNPSNPTLVVPVDLTTATSAKINAKISTGSGATTWSNALAITAPASSGTLTWTPTSGDTALAGHFNLEIEVTWNDGGIETFPNDGYFTIDIVADLG